MVKGEQPWQKKTGYRSPSNIALNGYGCYGSPSLRSAAVSSAFFSAIYKPFNPRAVAAALMNQGVALASLGRRHEAVARYDEAIALWERDVANGMTQITSNLLKALGNRFFTHRQLGQWTAAAADVARASELTEPFRQGDGLEGLVWQEFIELVGRLRTLEPKERQQLYDRLGEKAEVVRGLMEQDEA